MSTYAYWITPKGEIIEPDLRHINAIAKNPKKFGETDKTIEMEYTKYNEPMGVEGKAREEIMVRVIKRGFIRIRQGGSRGNQKWSIQLNKLNSHVQDHLWLWARKMIDSRIALDKFADVTIHQLSNNKMTRTSLNKIASGGGITEDIRIYRESELHLLEDYFDYAEQFFEQLHEDAQQELIDRGYVGHVINERIHLDESSLSRIWTHIRQDKRSFGLVSAFRNAKARQLTRKENDELNEKLHLELKNAVRTLGYGYVELQGGFKEETGFTLEKSLFIPNIKKNELIELGKKYDQYSVIYKDDKEFVEIGTNKNAGIGKKKNGFVMQGDYNLELAQNVIKDFFSRLIKGSHRGKKFLFKLQEREEGSFNRLAYNRVPLGWVTIYEDKGL